MKKLLIFFLILTTNDLNSQSIDNCSNCIDTLLFSFEEDESVDLEDIVRKGFLEYYDYIEFEKQYSNPVGYIIKFISINSDSLIFSVTYFYNKKNLSNYGTFSHYTTIDDEKFILMYSSDSIINDYNNFIKNHFFKIDSKELLNNIKFKKETVIVDVYFEGIVKYSDKKLTIEICPDFRTPFEYKPQSDEYLQKLLKRLKIMKERDLEK